MKAQLHAVYYMKGKGVFFDVRARTSLHYENSLLAFSMAAPHHSYNQPIQHKCSLRCQSSHHKPDYEFKTLLLILKYKWASINCRLRTSLTFACIAGLIYWRLGMPCAGCLSSCQSSRVDKSSSEHHGNSARLCLRRALPPLEPFLTLPTTEFDTVV